MKRFNAAVACCAFLILAWAAINLQREPGKVDAQDSAKTAKTEAPKVDKPRDVDQASTSNDQPYPMFFIDDVVTLLKTSADELIDQKIAKNSDDLRKHLDRTTFSTKLPRSNSKELSPQELYQRAIESVFLVAGMTKPTEEESGWQTAFSTAFAVHEDGILSTSAHVFDHEDHDDAVLVLDVQGKIYPIIELLAVDRKADTCLFRIGATGLKPLPLGKEKPPGSPIQVMGHPGDSFFFFSAGHIANYERDEDNLTWLNVTADFGQGSSGGPVMDSAGNVVGQVSRTFTLYASGDSTSRRKKHRIVRQATDTDAKVETKDEPKAKEPDDKSATKKFSDPQMVFKACTPVSAIRALVK